MRVTNRASSRNYLKYMNKALSDQQKIADRMQSGTRFEKISDDVSAGVQAMRTQAELERTKNYYNNIMDITDTLNTAEDAMQSVSDSLKELSSKLVKANSSSSPADRNVIAQQFATAKQQIVQTMNSQYAGQYLFGGTNNYTAPFTIGGNGKLQYNGIPVADIQQRDDGSYFYVNNNQEVDVPMNDKVYLDIGLGIRMSGKNVDPQTGMDISFAGPDIFGFGKNADGISNNVFDLLTDLETKLKDPNYDPADPDVAAMSSNVSKIVDRLDSNVTELGVKGSFLDSMENRISNNKMSLVKKMSRLVDTDFSEEAIHQVTNDAVVKAIYQMGASVVPMSLMDFLR